MSKIDLEPLVCLKRARMDIERGNCEYNVTDYLDTIEAALLELKSIKEANSSEALECLEDISKEEIVVRSRSSIYMNPNDNNKGAFTHLTTVGVNFKGALETVRHSLLKAREQEIDITRCKITIDSLKSYNALLKDIKNEQEQALKELFENHIELVIEKDRCYFKIKNSKGNEKSFTSYTMLDFWKEVLK